MIALGERRGKALNDSELLRRARGRYALLLNEDSELRPGATLALWRGAPGAPATRPAPGARLLRPDGTRAAVGVALSDAADGARRRAAPAPPLHRAERRRADARGRLVPVGGAARAARRRPTQVGYLDPDFFVYSDEVDFARRLRDAGWRSVYVPRRRGDPPRAALDRRGARAADRRNGAQPRPVHAQAPLRGGGARGALADRVAVRAARARGDACCRATPPRRYWRHVTATLRPSRGEGLREAAERYNREG